MGQEAEMIRVWCDGEDCAAKTGIIGFTYADFYPYIAMGWKAINFGPNHEGSPHQEFYCPTCAAKREGTETKTPDPSANE